MKYRALLLAAASIATLAADAAWAADAAATDEGTAVETLVVTGVRAPRSRLDTVSPVDVVSAQDMAKQATTETAQALANLAPSIDFPRPSITDGTDSIRPATLRGLAPDQTLVLVNGVRRHQSALVNLNGSIGRGSSAVDLNTIPSAALSTVEILREGASAQYGSDAIAGVINLRLRDAREGGNMTVNAGIYDTTVKPARIPDGYKKNDGATVGVSGWKGFALGSDGFATLAVDLLSRQPTARSDLDPRDTPVEIRSAQGDARLLQETISLNMGLPINSVWTAYGWANYQHRDTESAATARIPSNVNNDRAIYPDGFLPKINPHIDDLALAAGVRGDVGGFHVDTNLSYGENRIHYFVKDSINGSMVPNSPTDFDAGTLSYNQTLFNVDAVKEYGEKVTLALGGEYRAEHYEIGAGLPPSYQLGTNGKAGVGPGSQGFIGFSPKNVTSQNRHSESAYVDVDFKPIEHWDIDVAGRYEDYSDFGTKSTGKIASRYDFTDHFAIRGAASTGFRAPALQQQAFTSTAINFLVIAGVSTPTEIVTLPPSDPIAQSLGAQPLRPETSVNYSAGLVFHSGPFELTVDAYQIKIKDRIVLSENLNAIPAGVPGNTATTRAIYALLNPTGGTLGGARFFINGVDSTTKGLDIVARYRHVTDTYGNFNFTLAANFNDTEITKVPAIAANIPIPSPPPLFNRINVLSFEEGTPKEKITGSVDWTGGMWSGTLRAVYYSHVIQPFSNTDPTFDVDTGSHVITDLEGRYKVSDKFTVAAGVNNLFDEYPDKTPAFVNTSGATPFSNYSPFGFNGRFFYTRLSVDF